MTHINFMVNRSKVKVTVTFNIKSCKGNNLRMVVPFVRIFDKEVGHDLWMSHIDFRVSRSKVKVVLG